MTDTAFIRPAWTPITIGLMVLGFVIFWPLGLVMLAYILWGDQLPAKFKLDFSRPSQGNGNPRRRHRYWRGEDTGNTAFDDYRKGEFERLEAERRKLEEERAEFEDFLANLRQAKDQEEFDRFMAARASTKTSRRRPRNDDTIEL